MFEGMRDRRSNRDEEARDAAIAAATTKLARRRMHQSEPPREAGARTAAGKTEAGAATRVSSVANQLGVVARHASSVYDPTTASGANADGIKSDENENIENKSMAEAGQTLTVGAGIRLKGEITNCHTLIIEGHVEGSAKSGVLEISNGGAFVGEADIDTVVVSGRFEGTLTAAKHLEIRASGRVSGDIRYADIAIEAGGQISGDIQVTESPVTESRAISSENASYPPPAADDRSLRGQDGRVEHASQPAARTSLG